MTRSRARRLAVLMALLAAGLVACADDTDDAAVPSTIDPADVTTTTATGADPDGALPPAGAAELEPLYGAQLAELGLRLTDRGGLIDRTGGGYEPSAEGTHLALYVEPIGERSVPQYIDGIRSVAAVFGDVFDRWPGLASYDVCQEPEADDGLGGEEPLPVTQIELTRVEAAAFDWDTVSVVDLVRSAAARPAGLALRVSPSLANDPAYLAIVDEAS